MTEPSVGDPAHTIPVVDITDANNLVKFSTTLELQRVINELNHTMSYNLGYQKGVTYILESLGMTFRQFVNKKAKRRS